MANTLCISSASRGCRIWETFCAASSAGIRRVEVVPFKRTSIQSLRETEEMWGEIRIASVHGAMWTSAYRDRIIATDRRKKAETMVANWLAGSLETNPGIEIARELEVPLVLHAGIWFEIQQLKTQNTEAILDRLRGLPAGVSWEAGSYPHLWSPTNDEGLRAAARAYDEATLAGVKSTITVDNAHAARHLRGFSPGDALLMTASVLMNREVFQVHISDVRRGVAYADDQNHLPFGNGEINLERTLKIIGEQWPSANITLEVTGRWDFALPWRSVRPLAQSISAIKPLLE